MLRSLLFAAALCTLAVPVAAQQQEQNCSIDLLNGDAEGTADGFLLIHDPFIVTCDDGAVVSANSGRLNQVTREVYLYGDVRFEDSERLLTSNEATYDANAAHLIARGEVVYTDKIEGSVLKGPELDYFRATEERPQSQMTATLRPTLTLIDQSPDGTVEQIELIADRISMIGEDDLSAFGGVLITRSDFTATSDEARHNPTTGSLELRQNARITSQERELTGEVIQARLVNNALEHVRARNAAELRGEDLTVTAEDLQMFFSDEKLERAVAVGGGEGERSLATAASPGFHMVSDSLDAIFVAEQLTEVHAIGRARAESVDTSAAPVPISPLVDPVAAGEMIADTTAVVPGDPVKLGADTAGVVTPAEALAAVDLLGSDWVSGDTIIGYFEPRAPEGDSVAPDAAGAVPDPSTVDPASDPASSVEVRRIVAIGSAQSLYRVRPQNAPDSERRDLNWVVGDRIELEIAEGELEVAQVTGLQYGVYLEASGPAAVPTEPAPTVPESGASPAPGGGAR